MESMNDSILQIYILILIIDKNKTLSYKKSKYYDNFSY